MNAQAFRRIRLSHRRKPVPSGSGCVKRYCWIPASAGMTCGYYESLEHAARLVYVTMTRATHEVVLAVCVTSLIVERVREALEEVGRRFAEGKGRARRNGACRCPDLLLQ